MRQLIADSVELLRDMVRIPSESFSEGDVCSLVSERLESWGIDAERIGNNIVSRNKCFDETLPSLALDAHIDTVPASKEYTRDPLDPGSEDSVVYGLGSNDDGGSVVSMIAAFRYYYESKLPVNLVLALSAEEERSGSEGAVMLYEEGGVMDKYGVKWVIVGEPTQMKAATSERGLLVLDGVAHGVQGHAARNEGVNALYIALEDIEKLRGFQFERVSPQMGAVKLAVTQISAGTAHNVVPDRCEFVVDIRPNELYDNAQIFEMLQRVCKSELRARNLKNCSSATYPASPLSKACEDLGIETFSSPTTSDWMRTHRDAVKMGPGDSARSHKADEFIFTSEIEKGIELYIKYIAAFYGNIME